MYVYACVCMCMFLCVAVDFMSGCVAGGVATLSSFPFDVLRTRLLSQGEPKVSEF